MESFPEYGIDFSEEATDSVKNLSKNQYEDVMNSVVCFYLCAVDLHGSQRLEAFSPRDKEIVIRFFGGYGGNSLWIKSQGFLMELRRWRGRLRVATVILAPTLH